MDIEPGDLVVETDHSVCPHVHHHRQSNDMVYDDSQTGKRFVVRTVEPNREPGLAGCFLLTLVGTGDTEWCYGTFRKLRPDELPQAKTRKLETVK